MQSINMPQAALLAGMQQGGHPNPYTQGPLAFARGGLASLPRGRYAGGSIGGGIIQGTPMSGGRTGYWKPWKKAKKLVKKLIPKEIAPAMMAAAPFMGPIAGPIMGGLGSYKTYGKIDPLVMAASFAPHLKIGTPSTGGWSAGYGKWGDQGGSSLRRLLTGVGKGSHEGLLNIGNTDAGKLLDATIFGREAEGDKVDAIKGIFDVGGKTFESGEMGADLIKKMMMTGGKKDPKKLAASLHMIFTTSDTYQEALRQAEEVGLGAGDLPFTNDREYEKHKAWYDQQGDIPYKKGGRVGYAMGSAQFPPQKRTGLQWGSDKGEGLGGMEVEADMRYEGGFMPYGEEPKADDVPARLSKDEFVFTDEAVAGAGDGDVNVGAERLYNVMKNLEQGGRLSEETEGIGAMV